MHRYATYLVLFLLGLTPIAALCATPVNQDTIRPVFTTLPSDSIVACDGMVVAAFEEWYNNQAFSEADNGEANIFPSLPQNLALDSLESVIQAGCSGPGMVQVGFFALDSCNNQSIQTIIGSFIIVDETKPNIDIGAADYEMLCISTAQDSLQNWIDTQGGAITSDNCGTTNWKNYVWTDDQGNQGFINFGDSTSIVIQRVTCAWSVDVTFFVEDECGNDNVTNATFSIIGDNEQPTILSVPNDTTLLCGQDLPLEEPTFIDNCDGVLTLLVIDSLTQVTDENNCAHYNYELIRRWVASDACQNTEEVTTTYTFVDSIAPVIIFDATVAVDCNVDIDNNIERFITSTDGCSSSEVNYRDSLLFNSTCQSQLIRTWTTIDICGNQDSVQQTIQIQDFTGPQFSNIPRDTILSCQSSQIEEAFTNWLNLYGVAGVSDNCNQYFVKQLPQGTYGDTISIINTAAVTFTEVNCNNDTLGILGQQAVSFIAYDICGNINSHIATFSIADTISPTILNCPIDFSLQVNASQCAADYFILLPSFTDNCLTINEAKWDLDIDGNSMIIDQQGVEISLGIGVHNLSYTLKDCGGNTSSCTQEISVFDNAPPIMTCPQDITLYTTADECTSSYIPEPILSYTDNCTGELAFEQTLPNNDGFLSFSFNSVTDIYQVSDFPLIFDNVIFDGLLFRPTLEIEYAIRLDQSSRLIIEDEQRNVLHTIRDGDCTPQKVTIELSEDDFRDWTTNGSVRFTIINEFNSGAGTIPCMASNISGIQGTDQVSFFKATLGFSDIIPDVSISNTGTGNTINVINQVDLEPGTYITKYETNDAVNNLSSCLANVEVIDTTTPSATCTDINYIIDPLLENFYPILEGNLIFDAEDNCSITKIDFSPRQVLCSDLNQDIVYQVEVTDAAGNSASCSALIQTELIELNPEFISNLCQADTLRLFSNLPDNIGLDFSWSGPNAFISTENNPVITGINDLYSGTYTLEAASSTGCVFTGTLDIDVKQFDSPEIFTNQNTICNGEELLLNTNSFTEIVEYLWHEGISPNGTLIGRTTGPSLALQPTTGTHFFYVEVQGDNCNSNPSNTTEILVTPPPIAEVSVPLLTHCEGDDITLMTDIFNASYAYEWSGPNNYNSIGQFPEVIQDIDDSNEGTYRLIIKDGGCISDTATVEVIIFPAPAQPIIDGENIFCEGQSAVFTVPNIPNGTKYIWFNNGLFFKSVSSNSLLIPAITNSQSGEWTVIVEEGICSSDTSNVFDINIESSLNIGATNDGPHCEGDEVELTVAQIPGASYSWQDPTGSTYQGSSVIAPAIDGIYTVTVTTASNCEAVRTTSVEVGTRPTITALSNTSLPCMSGTMPVTLVPTVFPPGIYVYDWSGPNGFTSSAQQPVIPNVNEQSNGNYILTVIQDNCASIPSTTIIDINEIPDQPIIVGNSTPCEGVNITIEVSNPVSSPDNRWFWTTPTGTTETSMPKLELQNFSSTLSGIYTVNQRENGCNSIESEAFEINIQTEPITPFLSGALELCEGDDLSLTVATDDGDEYIWFTPNGTVTTNDNVLEINNITVAEAGGYRVFLRDGNCISDTSAISNITVSEIPDSPTFNTNFIEVCADDLSTLELCINNVSAINYDNLRLIDLSSGTVVQETTNACFDLSFLLNSDDNLFSFTSISSLQNCSSDNSETVMVQIYNSLQSGAEILQDTIFVCNESFTSLSAQVPNGVEVLWESENPNVIVFDETTDTPSIRDLVSGANTIFLNSSNGLCTNFATDTIVLVVIESISATDDQYELSFNQELILNPIDNDDFTSSINLSISTTPDEGQVHSDELNISYLPTQGYVGTEEFTYEICYNDCPDLCDAAMITLTIGVNVDCFVGNVITPNGDGYNDALTIPCLESGNFSTNSIIVFNQWGDEIYSAAPYDNDWAGTYNGDVLPTGTYFYILDLGDGSKPMQGYITLEL